MNIEDNGKAGGKKAVKEEKPAEKKDFSLKEGETITVSFGGKGRRNVSKPESTGSGFGGGGGFSLPPPPGSSLLPPPPSAQEVKAQKRLSRTMEPPPPKPVDDFGFDDGEFGEFQ